MHIPEHMLQGSICLLTTVVTVVGLVVAVHFVRKVESKLRAAHFGTAVALLLALQMFNFPILSGTSGHLLGGVLAAALLGTPFAVLAMALVVAFSAESSLGRIFGGGLAGNGLSRVDCGNVGCAGSWLGTGNRWAGRIPRSRRCDAGGTCLDCSGRGCCDGCILSLAEGWAGQGRLLALTVLILLLSPVSSELPDGLSWIAVQYGLAQASVVPDYSPYVSLAVMLVLTAPHFMTLKAAKPLGH